MAAPNLKEIEWAISELEGEESSEKRYSLLAALYTCKNEMEKQSLPQSPRSAYSMSAGPVDAAENVGKYGNSEFLVAVSNLPAKAAWIVIDDLMDTLHAVNPRVYNGVMRKLKSI